MKLCDYGCGQEAKYQFKNGKWCCSKNHKSCPSLKNKGIPDPKENIANVKFSCPYCGRDISYSNLKKHKNKCCFNPINIKYCENCNKVLINSQKKFCSSSCAASISNTLRGSPTLETKKKISKGVRKTIKGKVTERSYPYQCIICNTLLETNKLYCNKCRPNTEIASLSFTHYEKKLCNILNQFYGILKKEKINDKYPDFCNESVIIDFTFDPTRGVNDLIDRFEAIKNDPRTKIAYIPNKDVGIYRRSKLKNIKVIIKNSDPFRFLLNKQIRKEPYNEKIKE